MKENGLASIGSESVLTRRSGEVEILVLNRPEKLNAWTAGMRAVVAENLRRCSEDSTVGAVVITGAGDRAFCAGQDLAETLTRKSDDRSGAEESIDEFRRFYDLIRAFEKPLVAAVNGVAAGSGFQVALLCDVRIARAGARLGQPEVSSGMPSITGTYLMTAALGLSRTVEMVLSGRLMTAEEAYASGAVHEVVDAQTVVDRAVARAAELAAQPPGAVAKTKAWIREMTEASYQEAFRAARKLHSEAFAAGEPQREIESFFAARAKR